MTRVLLYVLYTFLLARPVWAGLRAEIVEFGEITGTNDRIAPRAAYSIGLTPTRSLDEIQVVDHTDRIAAVPCLRFGAAVRLTPDPGESLPDSITVVLLHPRLTRPDGVSATRGIFPTAARTTLSYGIWTFDHAWELQPGTWTFTFTHQGTELASKSFDVTVEPGVEAACSRESS